ncbi:hypothetical protein RR46_07341 [Papilio xuthus]|uniref:Uncharacterized protein n=1 Tax=Papilio xuthus TaxID=66420 RepID=A0A194PXW4_PAPXU|nr:hypothetical protein RR46_07341 [Papilio xuthus]
MDRRPGQDCGSDLDAGSTGPFIVAIFGGRLCPAVGDLRLRKKKNKKNSRLNRGHHASLQSPDGRHQRLAPWLISRVVGRLPKCHSRDPCPPPTPIFT